MAYNALARASVVIELFEGDEKYEANVVSTNGVILQPYDTSTTLIGSVLKNGVDITEDIKNIRWTKWNPTADNLVECPEWNAQRIGYSTILVSKDDIDSKSIFVFEAYNDMGDLLCSASISLVDINDLLVSTKEPENPYIGQLWVDDSTTPASLFVWNGYRWILAGAVGALIKNLLQNTGFAINFDKWEIIGETKLSFTPYPYDYVGHRFLKLQSETNVDVSRGISQTVREDILPDSEYSFQMIYYSLEDNNNYSNKIQLRIYSLDKYDDYNLLYEKQLTAENNLKKVYARFNSLKDTVAIRVEICGENGFRYHFNFAEAALYNTHNEYPWTIHPADLKIFGSQLTQEDVWNILSCNGTVQGIFTRINPDTGQLEYYINASMIQAGKMKAQYMEMYGLKVLRRENGEETDKTTLEVTEDGDIYLNVKKLVITSENGTDINAEDKFNKIDFEISPEQFQVKVDKIATDENGKITEHITSIATQTAEGFAQDVRDEVNGQFSHFEQTIDGFKTEVRDEMSGKFSAFEQTIDGFKTEVKDEMTGQFSSFEQTLEGFKQRVENAEGDISEVGQTADKIYWIIEDGEDKSSMTLTKEAYELISKNVTIKAERITLEGYTTINGDFHITLDGSMKAKNGEFSGKITASEMESTSIKTSTLESSTIIAPDIFSDKTQNPAFSLTSDGTLKAYNATISGNIEGAVIEAGTLKNKNGKFSVESDGVLVAEGAQIKGNITAGSTIKSATIIGSTIQNAEKDPTFKVDSNGTITGAKIQGGSIGIGGDKYNAFTVDNAGNCNISKGTIKIGSNFSVSNTGVLTAKSASFTGEIKSGSKISGSTIIGTTIQNKDANPTFIVDKDGNVTGAKLTGGSINIGDGKFKVDSNGNLSATSGSFTGTINSGSKIIGSTIQNSEKNPTFSVDANGNIKGGSININNAFTVTSDGKLTATNATITGKITATSGKIEGDTIIDGDCIAAGTVSASKLVIGDTNNYCEANEMNCEEFNMTAVDDPNEAGSPWMQLNTVQRSTALVKGRDGTGYKRYTGNVAGTYRIQYECSSSAKGYETESSTSATYLKVKIGFYCKDKTGTNKYYYDSKTITSTSAAPTVSIDSSITLPNTVQSFGVYLQVVGVSNFSGKVKIKNVRVTRMTDNALIVNGSITADHINGKTLTGVTLQNASKTFKVDANGNISGASITASAINIKDGNFKVTTEGAVTATNIKITGGSLNINDAFKVSSSGVLTATGATISGKLTSTSGTIGGFTIGSTTLKGSKVGIGSSSASYAFWAGSDTASSAPFRVSNAGAITATNATITGTISGSKVIGSVIQNAASSPTFTIDKNGNITGASLKSSSGGTNGNFSIDSEGNIEAQNLAVEGEVSTDVLICNEIRNKAYPKTLTSGCTIYVVSSGGDDDNECKNGAKFATLQGAINSIPKNMNGKVVNIHLQKNTTEDVKFNYFSSGRIYLYLNGKTIYGYLSVYCSSVSVLVYGGDSTSSTTVGKIRPVTGSVVGSRTVSIGCDRSTYLSLYYINVYASTNQASGVSSTADKVGVASTINGYIYCSNVKIIDPAIGFRTNNGGRIHIASSSGIAGKYGFESVTGGIISFTTSTTQAGGTTAATKKSHNGQIWADGVTFATGTVATPTPAPTPTKVKKTKTFTSSSANAIQYYGQSGAKWRSDSKPKVGTWGYGPHTGWWFFGDDFEEMASKSVYQIDITFTRQQGGNYAAHSMYFYTHNYETQPSTTSPSYYGTCIGSKSLAINTTGTFSITNETYINKIKSYKGICSIPSSQSTAQYAVFSATMKVKFYYEE